MIPNEDFLDQLKRLQKFSEEPCLCDGIIKCRRCFAILALEDSFEIIKNSLQIIEDIPQSIS